MERAWPFSVRIDEYCGKSLHKGDANAQPDVPATTIAKCHCVGGGDGGGRLSAVEVG